MAIRASSDCGCSTSSSRVLSDCTISGPSVTSFSLPFHPTGVRAPVRRARLPRRTDDCGRGRRMNQPPYPSWQPDPYGVPPGGNRPPSPPYGEPAPYGQPPRHGPSYRQQPAPYGQPRSYGQPESYGQQPYDQPAQPHGQRSYGQPPPFGRPAPPPSDDFPPPPPPHGQQPVRPDEYPPSAL